MRRSRGFTLIELMVTIAIAAILGGILVWQGRSARQSADLAGGAFDLSLRLGALKPQAVSDAKDYLLVVLDALDPAACVQRRDQCGRVIVLRDPQAGFTIAGFDPTPPIANAEWIDDAYLPKNVRFDLATAWKPPVPFNTVTPWDTAIKATCAGGRACFAIRYRSNGDVAPFPGGAAATPAGFAFVLAPFNPPSAAAQRRGLFVSFPAGLVKTAAF